MGTVKGGGARCLVLCGPLGSADLEVIFSRRGTLSGHCTLFTWLGTGAKDRLKA